MRSIYLLAFAMASVFAHAQTFTNGNFAGDASGWSSTDVDFGGYNAGTGSDGASGYFWINSNGSTSLPRVEQTVTGFNVGTQYNVTWWARTRSIFNQDDVMKMSIDDNFVWDGPNQALNAWTEFSHTFTATATSHKFTWHAEITGDSDWSLDTVSTEVVPEPATFAAASLILLAIKRKRKRS